MSYQSIVVFLDNSQASKARLEFAFQFAQKHRAHLTGIHMSTGPLFAFDAYGQTANLAVEWEQQIEKKRVESKEYFLQQAKNFDVNVDWDSYRDIDMDQVLARARVADLCMVGQVANIGTDNEIDRNFFTRFMLNVGKPVLYIPHGKEFTPVFEKIMVAWDGGRESARAIADAMPLLQAARIVCVMTVVPKRNQVDDFPDVDIAAYLARHKVNVEIDRVDNVPSNTAEFILSRIELKCTDLLVMGGFGHTRFSELILGGMTRTMMKQMTVPVLMSH